MQAQGEISFTSTYLLQLRLCFGELPYQLRIRFVPRSVPFEESEKHPLVQEMFFFPREQIGFLAEHLVCKNVQPWLRVSFASTSQPSLYLVPYSHSLLFLPSILPSIRVFSNESALCIRWPKCWSFSFNISSFNAYLGLISSRTDWFDLLAFQGTLKNLLQWLSY